jgi:hypothetical protein
MPSAPLAEIRSILSTLVTIRTLKHVANGRPESLRNTDGTSDLFLNRTLLRLRRQGLIKSKGSQHSLTPAGRKALKLAISGLKTTTSLTSPSQTRSQ